MKTILLILSLILSIVVITEPAIVKLSSAYNFCNTIKILNCCQTEEDNHCNSQLPNLNRNKSCSDQDNCGMVCCASLVFLIKNNEFKQVLNAIVNHKELIFSKHKNLTKGFKSSWFHPPNYV